MFQTHRLFACCNIHVADVFFVYYNLAVWFCESRPGAARFEELRSGGVGGHQVSFVDHVFTTGPRWYHRLHCGKADLDSQGYKTELLYSPAHYQLTHCHCVPSRDRQLPIHCND